MVDKPSGLTSHDVVAAARRALGQPRIGHAGTLDPLATGVLVLLLGQATRLAQYLSSAHKTYLATIAFGQATSTYDAEGTPVGPSSDQMVPREAVERTLAHFRGRHQQVPPAVSAKKVGGTRAYELVRSEQPVALAPVEVEVTNLELVAFEPPTVQVRVTASAGFYVRTLAHDLGSRLGVGGHLAALRRERSGAFGLSESIGFERLVSDPAAADAVVPMAELLPGWPAVRLTPAECERVRQGQPVAIERPGAPGKVRLLGPDDRLAGLADCRGAILHPVLVLM